MVLISVISGLLMCSLALLIWISVVKTNDLNSTSIVPVKNTVASNETVVQTDAQEETQSEAPSQTVNVSLDIDEAITKVQGTTDYLSASDYSVESSEDNSNVVNQGVELKKPVIAQNLSVSQQSSFSRDIVKYTDYVIQEGIRWILLHRSLDFLVRLLFLLTKFAILHRFGLGQRCQFQTEMAQCIR